VAFFGVLFFLLIGFLFFRSNIKRGKNFIRAYYYLLCLKNGKTPIEANQMARDILTPNSNADFDNKISNMAVEFAKEATGGKQLPIINKAISQGYLK
jgi:hypothetical protein